MSAYKIFLYPSPLRTMQKNFQSQKMFLQPHFITTNATNERTNEPVVQSQQQQLQQQLRRY
jgi:hypothetical protein